VETFDVFTHDNDPYGEHDFGAFEHNGQRIFWKIDYYDLTMTIGSEDPSDPKHTVRVLTVMLASDYGPRAGTARSRAVPFETAHRLGGFEPPRPFALLRASLCAPTAKPALAQRPFLPANKGTGKTAGGF
jgi:hypothetical protein